MAGRARAGGTTAATAHAPGGTTAATAHVVAVPLVLLWTRAATAFFLS